MEPISLNFSKEDSGTLVISLYFPCARENTRLSENGLKAGTVTTAKHAETVAALKKAELEELQASLEYRLAIGELDKTFGLLAPSNKKEVCR